MILPFSQKASVILAWKNTLKGDISSITETMIFILENMVFLLKYYIDWHSRLTFYKEFQWFSVISWRDLYRRFCVLLSSEKTPRNLIYRIEIWLSLQFIWLEILYNEESSILCSFSSHELYLEVCLSVD